MHKTLPILWLALSLCGCATLGEQRRHRASVQSAVDAGLMMLGEERVKVGQKPYRSDCSGFVIACYDSVGKQLSDPSIEASSGTEILYRSLSRSGRVLRTRRPRPGDLAFFHNTWDRNGNGLRDDRFTHVAIVERVAEDGTIQFLHFAAGRVKRDVMNLRHPGQARDPQSGNTWNSYLRRGGGRVLSGQLFFRFGRLRPGG